MDTKHRILDEALTLFSEKGYANVYVADIAARVGIKAPSLYKHYRNKQAIFDAIIEEMNKPIEMNAEPISIIERTFPNITLQSGEAMNESAMPSMIYDDRHIRSITRAERNFAATIAGILTGEVRSA